jgi:tetratricopeptide (TPR) repeat protein
MLSFDSSNWLSSKTNAGHCHVDLQQFELARSKFKEAFDFALKNNMATEIMNTSLFLANFYTEMHDHKRCIKCLKFTIKYGTDLKIDIERLVMVYQRRAKNHLYIGQYDEAMEWYLKSVPLAIVSSKAK